ncbi:hypothetical protein V2I29_05440 [Campylobacter sp. CX2-8023-23]|uniref:hypothetical protein n=1 Tax=Campylobacter porcelli TaxID=1660073 RepID=UPI002ECCB421|nr:hypothetical protein [Campylobacter sp. CX2-8023-23]MEE3777002.1 hypothetical protein [Campylobacter sp. CX2-4080-23]
MSLNTTINNIIKLYFNIFYVKIAKYLKIGFWKSEFNNGKTELEILKQLAKLNLKV